MRNRLLSVLLLCPGLFAGDVLTYHNDNARTGQNLNETILTPANVTASTFGKLFNLSVDGKVDAEPLYASAVSFPAVLQTRNALYVVTEHDSVYAFDADTGQQMWKVSLLGNGETTSDARNCGQVVPEIGITSTPVIARGNGPHGTIYVVAMSKDAANNYHQRLHALDMTTGAEQFNGPVEVQASYPGAGDNSNGTSVIFDPKQYKERAALLLLNGVIYTSWSSHCDIPSYTGWIIGYDANTLAQSSVFNISPNGSDASIWMSGAGPATDASGNIYFLAANGTFDSTLNANAFPAQGDFGNAFIKLSVSGGVLSVADYFAMLNAQSESSHDVDLGSGGALVLPDMTDAQNVVRQLAVGAGKDGHIYLVDRNNMGKFNPSANQIYQDLPGALPFGEFGMAAYFNGAIYYGGVSDVIRKFTFTNARLNPAAAATTSNSFGYPGATPSISANGAANGIVWASENTDPAIVHAYAASDLHELYNSSQAGARDQFGSGNKYITPMIAYGKVYDGTTNSVGAFGLLNTVSLQASGTIAAVNLTVDGVDLATPFSGPIAPGAHTVCAPAAVTGQNNNRVIFASWQDSLSTVFPNALCVSVTIGQATPYTLTATFVPGETVSPPNAPSGPAAGVVNTSYAYSTGGATSSIGHPVQYFFDWGDGTNSGWLTVGTTSASHTWTTWSTYRVQVQARCSIDTGVTSLVSQATVEIGVDGISSFVFVRQLYRDLLAREPDAAGLAYWQGLIGTGAATRAQAAAAFFQSNEFSGTGLYIIKVYLAVLGRDPDFAGWRYWFSTVQNPATGGTDYWFNTPAVVLLSQFLNSQEFITAYGNLNDSDFLTRVYQNVLGRLPDPAGLQYWLGPLQNGALTRAQVFDQFVRSVEYDNLVRSRAFGNLMYMGFLQRSADPSGLAYWTQVIANGAPLPNVVQGFISSTEYLNRLAAIAP